MNQHCCFVYPPSSSVHNYEQTLLDEFDLGVYMSHTDSEAWGSSNFGPIYQLASKTIDSDRFHRALYSRWRPPEQYETIISSRFIGKEVGVRPHQRHIHLAHGIHRGAFGLPPRTEYAENPVVAGVQKLNRLALRRRERRLLTELDTLVVNSEFIAELIEEYHGLKPDHVIHPPVYTERYASNRDNGDDFYLYLGRLAPIKGVEEIVRCFNQLDLDLVVAGAGELREKLERLANDNVRVVGYVSETRKRELLSNCAGFVQNTIVEDFGMTTVEAMAAGAPVVAVNDGNNPNLVQDSVTGVLFDRSADAETFQTADSVENLRQAVRRAERIRWDHDRIQETAAKYDVRNCCDKWQAVLDEP